MYAIIPTVLFGAAAVSAKPVPSNDDTAIQVQFEFPLADGFPNRFPGDHPESIPSHVLNLIEENAHGNLPNGRYTLRIDDETVTMLQLIAYGEIMEVAFFHNLLHNITSGVLNFEIAPRQEYIRRGATITAILAQEKLHYLAANSFLATAGHPTVPPCKYVFPSNAIKVAMDVAKTFTAVNLGTLQEVVYKFATDGDPDFTILFEAIAQQEAEQEASFRDFLGLLPSGAPFLSRSTASFYFSLINQIFVVPGSCKGAAHENLRNKLPSFPALTVTSEKILAVDQTLSFSVDVQRDETLTTRDAFKDYCVVYFNQQNEPFSTPPTNFVDHHGSVTFEAEFPARSRRMYDLTLAVITKDCGPHRRIDDIAKHTVFGPAPIMVG